MEGVRGGGLGAVRFGWQGEASGEVAVSALQQGPDHGSEGAHAGAGE